MTFTIKVAFKNLKGDIDFDTIKSVRAWGCDPSGSLKVYLGDKNTTPPDFLYAAGTWQKVLNVGQTDGRPLLQCYYCEAHRTAENINSGCSARTSDGSHLWKEKV